MLECDVLDAGGDRAIAALAARQHGVVARRQLRALGLGDGAIKHRVRNGRLHRLHRGVFLVGHPVPPPLAREMAAVLACGDGAALSHRSAAALWGLIGADEDVVEVTVSRHGGRSRRGLRAHRSRTLMRGDVVWEHGIAVTTPVRTLLDLAATATAAELERALAEALRRRIVTLQAMRTAAAAASARRGIARLVELLDREGGPALTRSAAEDRFLALIRAAGLPAPETNARVGRYEVDFLWREQGVLVEVDGYEFHRGRRAFERDRVRDADLRARGLDPLRVTWRQIVDGSYATVARVARALALAA